MAHSVLPDCRCASICPKPTKTGTPLAADALRASLHGYLPPVDPAIIRAQMQLAAEEATDAFNRLNEDVSQDPTASGLLEGLNTEENRERLRAAAERSREFLSNASEAVRAEFERRPNRDKLVILSATMAAVSVGAERPTATMLAPACASPTAIA